MSEFYASLEITTDVEEEFFRSGNAMSETAAVESFADLDRDFQRPTLWQRLFVRSQDR